MIVPRSSAILGSPERQVIGVARFGVIGSSETMLSTALSCAGTVGVQLSVNMNLPPGPSVWGNPGRPERPKRAASGPLMLALDTFNCAPPPLVHVMPAG